MPLRWFANKIRNLAATLTDSGDNPAPPVTTDPNSWDSVEQTQGNNQASIDRAERKKIFDTDTGSGAVIDIAPAGLHNQGSGLGTNQPIDTTDININFGKLAGLKGPMQMLAFLQTPAAIHSFEGGRQSASTGPVVDLTTVVGREGIIKVSAVVSTISVGQYVDLYRITGVPDLVYGRMQAFNRVVISRFMFQRVVYTWQYLGLAPVVGVPKQPKVITASLDPVSGYLSTNAYWDVYPWWDMGSAMMADYTTCPFGSDCGALIAWVVNGRIGRVQLSNGNSYTFDGRIFRRA